MKYKSIYVAATSQHVGKTTSTLGLVSNFLARGLKVGYCKPVGQKYLDFGQFRVDKDALLFMDLIQFEMRPEIHSPVILGSSTVTDFLDHPEHYDFPADIAHAKSVLEQENELIIYEGTGHPGVGSVVNQSNARVAKMLDASVVMVVEGGIGSTIDMLNMCLALFRERDVPILGVIVNKVRRDKLEKVTNYVSKYLKKKGLPLLGVIPYDHSLAFPVMRTIARSVKGVVLAHSDKLDNKVEDIVAGSLLDKQDWTKERDLLLVTPYSRFRESISKIEKGTEGLELSKPPLAGIVVCGQGEMDKKAMEYVEKHEIPLVQTDLDTFGSVIRISNIEVKINRSTPWKVKRAIELIKENIDMDQMLIPK